MKATIKISGKSFKDRVFGDGGPSFVIKAALFDRRGDCFVIDIEGGEDVPAGECAVVETSAIRTYSFRTLPP